MAMSENETNMANPDQGTSTDVVDDAQNVVDIEKEVYTPRQYAKIQRQRRRALQYGITIPPLTRQFTYRESKRKPFVIVGIIWSIAIAGLFALMVALALKLCGANDLSEMGTALKKLFDPDVLTGSIGLSGVGGFLLIIVYVILATVAAVAIGIFVLLLVLNVRTYRYARISRQEMAYSRGIYEYMWLVGLIAVALAVPSFILLSKASLIGSLGIALAVAFMVSALAMGAFVVYVYNERKRDRQWCDDHLSAEDRADYLAHIDGMYRYKKRKRHTNI